MAGLAAAIEGPRLVDEHTAEWISANVAPGVELHRDPDATWIVQPGAVWGNAICRLRFKEDDVEDRLNRIIGRFRADGRGAGFWVNPLATPADIETRLRSRAFRCRKRFPAMACYLPSFARQPRPDGVEIAEIADHRVFLRAAAGHPYFGRITTPLRRFELSRAARMTARRPQRAWVFAAFAAGEPVGVCTLFVSSACAGLHDVGVIPQARNRGIGAALVAHACEFARGLGQTLAVLIASGMGESVYRRVGFREVCRMAYFYSAFRREGRALQSSNL